MWAESLVERNQGLWTAIAIPVAVLLTAWAILAARPRKTLDYAVMSEAPILTGVTSGLPGELLLTWQGTKLVNPRLVILRFITREKVRSVRKTLERRAFWSRSMVPLGS